MVNKTSELFQKLMQNPRIMQTAEQMAKSMSAQDQAAFLQKAMAKAPEGTEMPTDISSLLNTQGIDLGQFGSLALGAAKAHPFKAMALGGSAAGNVGGLMDNDKFGGQLAGLGIGGLGAYALAQGNPYLAAVLTMGGGNIGALFDKLRARKEMEQQQGIPNAGNPIAMATRGK